MGYQVEVQTGAAAGHRGPLKGGVLRVGSHSGMELAIPDLPPHALTIFQRGKKVLVLNRCDLNVAMGKTQIPAGTTIEWPRGCVLTVNGLIIRLLTERFTSAGSELARGKRTNKRQSKQTQQQKSQTVPGDVLPSASGKGKPGSRIQVLTIIVSLGMILLLQLGAGSSASAIQQRQKQTTQATNDVRSAIAAATTTPDLRLRLERLLQLAAQLRIAEAMNDKALVESARVETIIFCRGILLNRNTEATETKLVQALVKTL